MSEVMRFTMLAVPFNSRSQDLGRFVEMWGARAVRRTIDEHKDLRALKHHDGAHLLGRISSGTMRVHVDHRRLHAIVDADTKISYVADLARSVERRDTTGASRHGPASACTAARRRALRVRSEQAENLPKIRELFAALGIEAERDVRGLEDQADQRIANIR